MSNFRLKYAVVSVFTVLSILGCSDLKFGDSFLEKAPGVDVTIDTIFSSKLYADRALTSVYSTLRCSWPVNNREVTPGEYRYQVANNRMGWDILESLTDLVNTYCTWGGVSGGYYSGNYNPQSENSQGWTKCGFIPFNSNCWIGIRKAFIYINNVDRVPDMTDEEKRLRKGEAYMIIAIHYSDLLRHFGGVPLLKSDISVENVNESDFSRKSVQEVGDYILELCDIAADLLPWSVSDDEDGRMTKASALGLKCRVLSLMASPLFNSDAPFSSEKTEVIGGNVNFISEEDVEKTYWLGDYQQSRWQDVADACEAFFRENEKYGNYYSLVSNSSDVTLDDYRRTWSRYADRANGEILIASGRDRTAFADFYLYYLGPDGWGGGAVTLNFVDMFADFTTGRKSSYQNWVNEHNHRGIVGENIDNITPFTNKDPRLYESVMIVGDRYQGRCAEMWIGGLERQQPNNPTAMSGFCLRKFIWDFDDETFNYRPANYPYLRLAEIYLIYAEALNELGRKQEAMEQLDMTRRRVGLPAITDELLNNLQGGKVLPTYPEALKGDMKLREEILDERAREFFFEEVRWFDLARWKREDIFRKELQGIDMRIVSGTYETSDLVLDFSDPWEITERSWKKDWNPKWYLSAFPTSEINKGYGLVQNPGW